MRTVQALVLGRGGVDEQVEAVVAERAGAGQVHVVVVGVVALVAGGCIETQIAVRDPANILLAHKRAIYEVADLALCALTREETLSAVGNGHRAVETGEVGHIEELAHGTGRTAGYLRAVQALLLSRAGVDEQVQAVVT